MSNFSDPGVPIYERDWDLLIIVDACRIDLMQEVAPDYEFIDTISPIRSLNSATWKWMEENFVQRYDQEMSDTAYVCGNPFSEHKLEPNDFVVLEEVWRDIWEEPGTVPPRAVTDVAIETSRECHPERLIAHYMQPHCPFISNPKLMDTNELNNFVGYHEGDDVWDRLAMGELNREEVWISYRENLKIALNEIGILLNNIDAETAIITSDHGNALGEWLIYGHPPEMPLDCLRTVPWIKTTAVDQKTREPNTNFGASDMTREKKLTALGYL
jgi:hypothetical protein